MASSRRPRRGSSRGGGRRGGNSDKQYIGISGFIAFPPDDDEVDGEDVRRMKVQDGKRLYSVTVWASHEHVDLAEGDYVAIQGAYKETEGDETTYYNVSAGKLVVLGQDEGERKSSRKSSGSSSKGKGRGRPAPVEDDDDEDDEDDDF